MNCSDLFSLKKRNALIIGGAGLLGSQISEVLAEFGSNVIVASRNNINGINFVKKLKNKFKNINVNFVEVDINNPKSIISMSQKISNLTNNRLDILVNCGWSGNLPFSKLVSLIYTLNNTYFSYS